MAERCTVCGKEAFPLRIFAGMTDGKTNKVCQDCISQNEAAQFMDVEELDKVLAQYYRLEKDYEGLIQRIRPEDREMEHISPEIRQFGVTPMSMYRSIQRSIAALKERRLILLSDKGEKFRLIHALHKAVEAEDYEEAAVLKKKLEEVLAKEKDTQKNKG